MSTRSRPPPELRALGGGGGKADAQRIADSGVKRARAPLPHAERIARAFGANHNIDGIRATVGGAAAAASRMLGTEGGYATRERIAFARPPSLRVAAHEAAHIIQQRGGLGLAGGVGRPGDAHERHADAVADRVVRGQSASDLLARYAGPMARSAEGPAAMPAGPLPGAGGPVIQMWNALVKAPWMNNGAWKSGMKGGKVSWMIAEDLDLNAGAVVGAGKNAPVVSPKSWNQLKAWGMTHPAATPGYVRMHMLSDRLGGPGNKKDNLAPGTNSMNQKHFNKAEKKLINVLDGGGEIVRYKVVAKYQNPSKKLKSKKGKAAWLNTLDRLQWNASYRLAPGGPKKFTFGIIREKTKLDGKPNWKGH